MIVAQAEASQIPPPPVAVPFIQPELMNLPSPADLAALSPAGKAPVSSAKRAGSNAKVSAPSGKDRATVSDAHGPRKTQGSDTSSQSEAAGSASPTKLPPGTSGFLQQGNDAQSDAKKVQTVTGAQGTFTLPTSVSETAPHTATLAPDAPAQTVPSNASVTVDVPQTPALSGARLIQSVHQSEMKLGMNSAEFGNISISTSVSHQMLSAQISLDHTELGRALAAHLPAMEERLGNTYGLQARVEVSNSANSSYAGSSQQSGEGSQQGQTGSTRSTMFPGLTAVAAHSMSTPAADTSRLDIRI